MNNDKDLNTFSSTDTVNSTASQIPLKKSPQGHYSQVIRMLILVAVIFSICQIPDMIVQLLLRLYPDYLGTDVFRIVAYDFVMINSSINLFIYTATSKRFKKEMYAVFPFLCLRNKVTPIAAMTTVHES